MDQQPNKFKGILAGLAIGLFVLIVFGLLWAFVLGPEHPQGGVGWYLFAYAMGLTMIVLPCTLPLAFVIVPLSMGKGMVKGLGIAIAFGLGVALMLSMYGVAAAVVGKLALGTLNAPLETVKNWVYFAAGVFAYIFALGGIGLLKLKMPSYTGAAPGFIQKQQDYIKAFLLGLFLGNIGVGCPHPATPLIFIEIARAGDIFYGWSLFFVHAVGRVLPLLLLAFLGILGINALSWLVARKDKVERTTGWSMVFIAGFILVLGLFTHDWWVNSGQHTLFEDITQEERFLGIVSDKLNVEAPHEHGPEEGPGLLGLPLGLGNWVLVGLWVLPLWWYYRKKETNKNRWQFWFLVTFSVLLVLTFVFYLPTRFERNFLREEADHPHMDMEEMMHEDMEHMEEMDMMHGDEHEEAILHEEGEIAEGLAVNFNVTPVPVLAGSSTQLDFLVNDFSQLEINHEKLMHVIGVRSDLSEFFHIHPEPLESGIFTIPYVFLSPGAYKLWSEVTKDGVTHAFGHPLFDVQGEGERESKAVSFGRNVVVGDYQVSLELAEPVGKGNEHDLSFDVHTLDGREVTLENYLGVPMHLAVIKDDLTQFIHTHPEDGMAEDHHSMFEFIKEVQAHGEEAVADETVNFHVVFPEAGLYKAFAQFRPAGIDLPEDEALTASFWIQVEESTGVVEVVDHHESTQLKPLVSPAWWFLLAVSLALIVLLSLAVRRFITVKK
ncbi:MAG TPA: cytochrome c biogenesis protein CcdA [Candidatus Paceibacterota bacterium]